MSQVTSVEHQLKANAAFLFDEHNAVRRFAPRFPYVVVRVLPKSQKFGVLELPGQQNKTVHEGIVVARYSHIDPTRVAYSNPQNEAAAASCFAPSVNTGDLVVFPHFVGLPIVHLPAHEYRLIKETDIAAVIGFIDSAAELSRVVGAARAAEVQSKFTVLPKELYSTTLSGV